MDYNDCKEHSINKRMQSYDGQRIQSLNVERDSEGHSQTTTCSYIPSMRHQMWHELTLQASGAYMEKLLALIVSLESGLRAKCQ
jgi:hypothetical protein